MMATDPNLSDSGRARAKSLAAILKDSRISAIFVTEYKRTQETAAPIAKALGITPRVIAAKDTPALLASVRNHNGNVLVVGHSNSIPDVITGMGVKDAPVIADDEYDNLFIVTLPAALIHLHFR